MRRVQVVVGAPPQLYYIVPQHFAGRLLSFVPKEPGKHLGLGVVCALQDTSAAAAESERAPDGRVSLLRARLRGGRGDGGRRESILQTTKRIRTKIVFKLWISFKDTIISYGRTKKFITQTHKLCYFFSSTSSNNKRSSI